MNNGYLSNPDRLRTNGYCLCSEKRQIVYPFDCGSLHFSKGVNSLRELGLTEVELIPDPFILALNDPT